MLLVFSPQVTSRISYAFKLVLGNILATDFHCTFSEVEFKNYDGPKLSYGKYFGENIPFIPSAEILFEPGIIQKKIEVVQWMDMPIFYANEFPNAVLPFDIFGASFFLATRYEEYLPHKKDEHGRFQYRESIAFQQGFLEIPLINIWAEELKNRLQKCYPAIVFSRKHFQFVSTFDIDIAYAYKGRSVWRVIQATLKNIFKAEFSQLLNRGPVLAGLLKDPYDTYSIQEKLQQQYHLNQHYFILCGEYGPYDKNLVIKNSRQQRNLVKKIAQENSVGIHPSYASNYKVDKIADEKRLLEKVIEKPIISSRQHFLKLKFPDTYQSLVQCKIKEDYSMGYPDHSGFRASICTPYPFYDLRLEQETSLMIFPLVVMDNMLKDYMQLNTSEAIEHIKKLINSVSKVNGLFISIWHNQSLGNNDGWAGWLKVYEEMIKYASEKIQ